MNNALPFKMYHQDIVRPDWTQPSQRNEHALWLDKNECIDPVYNQLTLEWMQTLLPQAMYGYPDCSNLYHKLANWLGVSAENILFAAGSDGIIRLAYEAFIQPGDKVLYPTPTFAMYSVYAKIYGAHPLTVDYVRVQQRCKLDIDQFIQHIYQNQPKLICLPCPDSPTGAVATQEDILAIINAAEEISAIVLIDEAYYPFYDQTLLSWIHTKHNLLVARTFSKAWGLAGIRLGYAVGSAELIAKLHRLRPMYEIGNLSVLVAEKAIDQSEKMRASVDRILEGKHFFQEALQHLGFDVLQQVHGNFLHVDFGRKADKIHRVLQDKVLYRNHFSHPSLDGYNRFTASTKDNMQFILEYIQCALSGR